MVFVQYCWAYIIVYAHGCLTMFPMPWLIPAAETPIAGQILQVELIPFGDANEDAGHQRLDHPSTDLVGK